MKKTILDLETVRQLHRAGQLDEAKTGYLTLLRKNPRNTEVLHALGILCAQQDQLSEAVDYLQSALAIQPHHPSVRLNLANILKLQGLFSQAAAVLQEILRIEPRYAPALNNLGTICYAQDRTNEAIDFYRQAIAAQPDYIDAYYNLGLALTKKENFSEVISTYKTLLELAPDHFAARFHLGSAYMQQEKMEEAIPLFLSIAEAHPNHFETQSNLATCYLKQGALTEAKQHYLQALELMPEDTQILFNLGVINTQLGQLDIAIQYYQRAIRINPNLFSAHNNLGVAFLAKPHPQFALHHFQEALRIQPHNKAIQHTIHILSQHQHLLASPPDYVKSLFDSYADHYEPHLLKALDYQIPTLLYEAMRDVVNPKKNAWDILDIGCGTGLCGVSFKPFAKQLIGIDLSSKMLDVARQKNLYDELITTDLTEFLVDKTSAYDLILAGDVLVYMGDLTILFQEAHSALREKGLFIFNTEINDNTDFKMNQSGRFSHHKPYLEKLAHSYHFHILYYQMKITRMQNNEPVYGHIYVLQK